MPDRIEQDSLINFLSKVDQFNWKEGQRYPHCVVMVSESDIKDINILFEGGFISETIVRGTDFGTNTSISKDLVGEEVVFGLSLPIPNDKIAIVKDVETLLDYDQYKTRIPEFIYFVNQKCVGAPEEYKNTVAFINVLKIVSDHTEQQGGLFTCFFYDGCKVVVPIKYNATDMHLLPEIQELYLSFSGGPQLNEKIRIFKSAIIKVAISSPSEDVVFPHLIRNFQKIAALFKQDWDLYVSNFSLDEVLNELEEKILKIADKLSSSMSDLQRTMITIPLAIIFAAPRFDTQNIQSLTNILIVASVWIFALFTWAFFSSNKRALSFILDEINECKDFVEEKHKGVARKINQKFILLEKRCASQDRYRRVVGSLMWASVVFVTLFLFYPKILPLAGQILNSFFHSMGGTPFSYGQVCSVK